MRIALITGGGSGLGLATAKRLALDGMRVAIADLDGDAAKEAADKLDGSGHLGCQVDVCSERGVADMFEHVETQLGPVAALLNFAGILSTNREPGRPSLAETTLDEWTRVMTVNATGTFLCIREMARRRALIPAEGGRIVTLASIAGQVGGLQSGLAYSSSKGAILALSKSAARELAPLGITVNIIAPGPIDTPMLRRTSPTTNGEWHYGAVSQVPLGRIGRPEEIAAAAAYLVSPDAAFVTGATLDVNGGLVMR